MQLVRHEHVVRSAVIVGGHIATTVSDVIHAAVEKRSIFLPSPLRLLRLANGLRCEKCPATVHFSRPGFGIFFCRDCLVGSSWRCYSGSIFSETDRFAFGGGASRFFMDQPYTDSSGERAGPILTQKQIEKSTAKALLEEADKNDKWSDEKRTSLLECHKQARAHRSRLADEKKEQRRKRDVARVEKGEALIRMVGSFLDDDLCCKEEILSYSTEDNSIFCKSGLFQEKMSKYLAAPSTANKKRMKEVAKAIESDVTLLVDSGFHDLSFLSDEAESADVTSPKQKRQPDNDPDNEEGGNVAGADPKSQPSPNQPTEQNGRGNEEATHRNEKSARRKRKLPPFGPVLRRWMLRQDKYRHLLAHSYMGDKVIAMVRQKEYVAALHMLLYPESNIHPFSTAFAHWMVETVGVGLMHRRSALNLASVHVSPWNRGKFPAGSLSEQSRRSAAKLCVLLRRANALLRNVMWNHSVDVKSFSWSYRAFLLLINGKPDEDIAPFTQLVLSRNPAIRPA